MTDSIPSVVDILGANGVIARRLKDYEPRPEQLEMALAVESALTKRHHLIAEAGTGVGKSFAYLIPAILACFMAVVWPSCSRNHQNQWVRWIHHCQFPSDISAD